MLCTMEWPLTKGLITAQCRSIWVVTKGDVCRWRWWPSNWICCKRHSEGFCCIHFSQCHACSTVYIPKLSGLSFYPTLLFSLFSSGIVCKLYDGTKLNRNILSNCTLYISLFIKNVCCPDGHSFKVVSFLFPLLLSIWNIYLYVNSIACCSILLALWRYHQEWQKVHQLVQLVRLFLVRQLVLNVVPSWAAASIACGKR